MIHLQAGKAHWCSVEPYGSFSIRVKLFQSSEAWLGFEPSCLLPRGIEVAMSLFA